MIRLAPVGADFGHPINSDWNKDVRDNLLNWQKIAPQLFVWSYATNFHYYMMPHPNWDSIADDLRFFAANNVKGVYVEGDNRSKGVGDFVQLRAWLTGKLLWNPQLDQAPLMDEFLNGYYGAAGPYLKQYIQLVQQSFNSQNRKLNSFNDDFSFMTLDVMNQAQKYFDEAMHAVQGDKVLLDRVQREKLSLDLCWIKFYKALQKEAQFQNKIFLGPKNPQAALTEFVQTYKSYNPGAMGQGGATLKTVLPQLEAGVAPQAPLPDFAKSQSAIDVIDLPAGMLKPSHLKNVAKLVDDSAASSAKAMQINGQSNTWAVSSYLENYSMMLNKSRWHLYAILRFQEDAETNVEDKETLLTIGAYDRTHEKYFLQKNISLQNIDGDTYQIFDVGSFIPDGNTDIFIATHNKPNITIFLDRLLLIRNQ
jgi:hypothetical protein